MKPRTENETDALNHNLSKPEENGCWNCGWAFPPLIESQEPRYRYCSSWETTKPIRYWDRKWIHHTHVFLRNPPYWCHEDGTRKTEKEIQDFHSPEAVRERLQLKENPFKARYERHKARLQENKKHERIVTSYCKECQAGTYHSSRHNCLSCRDHADTMPES